MKKILAAFLIAFSTLTLASCKEERSADALLRSFLSVYSAEGVVYSPTVAEGEDGYIDEPLFKKIYLYDGKMPTNFAVFLNSHTDSDSECALFVCRDGTELLAVEEMCLERLRLLTSPSGFIVRSGNTVFYSTMSDKARAERIWRSIISH